MDIDIDIHILYIYYTHTQSQRSEFVTSLFHVVSSKPARDIR